jgi:hypothetical protein
MRDFYQEINPACDVRRASPESEEEEESDEEEESEEEEEDSDAEGDDEEDGFEKIKSTKEKKKVARRPDAIIWGSLWIPCCAGVNIAFWLLTLEMRGEGTYFMFRLSL